MNKTSKQRLCLHSLCVWQSHHVTKAKSLVWKRNSLVVDVMFHLISPIFKIINVWVLCLMLLKWMFLCQCDNRQKNAQLVHHCLFITSFTRMAQQAGAITKDELNHSKTVIKENIIKTENFYFGMKIVNSWNTTITC